MNISARLRSGSRSIRRVRNPRRSVGVEFLEERALLAVSPIPIGGDPIVDPADFRVTVFASGLNYPHGMTALADGSVLVGVASLVAGSNSYYDSRNTGSIIRLVDANSDGVADGPGQSLYDGLPGQITALHQAGNFLVATSSLSGSERISVLRLGATSSSPLTLVGSINFAFPSGWEHTTFASAVRPTPGQAGQYDLVFNIGSEFNGVDIGGDGKVVLDQNGDPTYEPTIHTVGVSGLVSGTLNGDSLYMVTLANVGGTPVASNLTQLATGLRNAASLAFDPTSGDLYLADNGIDGNNFGNNAWSTDEINVIPAATIGQQIVDFGFPYSYVRSVDTPGDPVQVVNPSHGTQPIVAFQPLPDPGSASGISKSEGPSGFAFSPAMFPVGLNHGIFTGFHGRFNSGGLANIENPLVFADIATGHYFNFVSNNLTNVGHLDEILSTRDSLFVADISTTGDIFGSNGPGQGVIYQIKAINHAPVISSIATQEAGIGKILSVQVTATDEDPGQTLQYNLAPGAPSGALIDPNTGLFTWTPTSAGSSIPVTVVVTDNGSPTKSTSRTFFVNVLASHAPTITPIPDQQIFVGETLSYQVVASDLDAGQTLTYSLGAGAPDGASIDPNTGLFTWTPTVGGSNLPVTVIVTDNDTPSKSSSATFHISVLTNHTPTIAAIPAQQILAGATLSIQVQASDLDSSQSLVYSLAAGAPDGASIDPASGLFTWTPVLGGIDASITVIVTDNGSPIESASQTFVVSVVANRSPVISPIPAQQVVEGSPLTVQVQATDPDPGQTLTYSLLVPVGFPGLSDASIDPTTGLITWTPQVVGANIPLTVAVLDNGSPRYLATQTFYITVTDAPIVATGPDVTIVTSRGTAINSLVIPFLDADLNGSASGYSATIDYGDRTITDGTVSFMGNGEVRVIGSHTYNALGTYTVTVTLRDGEGSSAVSTKTTIVVQPAADTTLLFADNFDLVSGSSDINAQTTSRQIGANAPSNYLESSMTATGAARDSLSRIESARGRGILRLTNSLSDGQPFTFAAPNRNFRNRRSMNQRIHVAVNPLAAGSNPSADHWAGVVFGTTAGSPRSGRGTGVLLDGSGNYQIWNRDRLVKSGQVGSAASSSGFHTVDISVNLQTGRYSVKLDGLGVYQGNHQGGYSVNYVSLQSISTSGTGSQYSDFDDLAIEAVSQDRTRLSRR